MADGGGAEGQTPVGDLTPEEVSRIIHSHRKVRYGTACWPCRQRKVKCDNQQPCENCTRRDHPQLCSYKPNRGSGSKHAPSDETKLRKRPRSASPDAGESLKQERQESWPRTLGSLDESDSVGDRYVGQNSIPALLREQSSTSNKPDEVDIRKDMRSILGLDTSSPFPLMSAKHMHRMTEDIVVELPSDREVMKLFRTYKEIPQTFWGFVADIGEFESKLMVYLEERARNATSSTRSTRPVTASWLAILFAVLAVGSQYHESPYHIRTRDSLRYVQISFHFLRLGNFLQRPSWDSIQALLLTCFVLVNDMKAEASWALVGLTCRLAQSLGLHRETAIESRDGSPEGANKEMIRRQLWWTCVWHDTLTSLSFDRAPVTNFPSCAIPISTPSGDGNLTYLETMYYLIEIISRRLNPDAIAVASYDRLVENCDAIESLRSKGCAHIRDKDNCKTAQDRLQFYAIRLHTSFIISVACRPALRRDCDLSPEQKKTLVSRCKVNLTQTVRMFLAMHQLSVIPTRSWAFTYHGLSSALLLGILGETKTDPEVRQLQGNLIAALSATAAKDASSPEPHVPVSDKDIELSGPLWRALTALRNIYNHGVINTSHFKRDGLSSAGGSGTRTPLPPLGQPQASALPNPMFGGVQPSADPREDAALAMAEMQNGGAALSEFPGAPFTQYLPNGAINDGTLGFNADPSQYLGPLDLYDSIWGETPELWNSGLDNMNFDFMAQPPPGQQSQQQFYF